MANLPKATDMEMDPAKQGQMVSPQGQETGVNVSNPSGQLFHQKTPPMPWGLMNFYGGEQPWVPPGIFGASHQDRQASAPSTQRRTPNGFQGWRSTLPSECDTGFPPSDSGYESRTKHSIENTSVFNDVDRSQDTQSLSGQIMEYHPFGLTPSDGNWDMAATPIPVPASQTSAVENMLICPGCQSPCKTRSELNKHHQRHRKAHKCDVPGCARTEGFGTLNDLDRHKGSVHPGVFNAGPRYRCIIGSCQTKDKIWPRADNFRQHLKRVHRQIINPEDDLSRFILSQIPQRPHDDSFQQNAQDALEGVGSELSSECPIVWDSRPPVFEDIQLSPQEEQPESMDLILDPSLKSVDGPTSDVSLDTGMIVPKAQLQNQISESYCELTGHEFVQPKNITRAPSPKAAVSELEDSGSDGICASQLQYTPINPSSCLKQDAPDSNKARDRTFEGSPMESMDCDAVANDPVHQEPTKSIREEESVDQDFPQEKVSMHRFPSGLPDKGLSQQAMFDYLSQVPKNVIETYLKSQAEAAPQKRASAPSINANSPHHCPHSDCRKPFNRKCELKKHMKRHLKPYGCTFPSCYKRFGSKNDWKRHENSQHFQVEMWQCHEKRADDENESCGKFCLRRETFRSHLLREHKMKESSQVDKELEKCRVGRDGEPRFWCGFCVKIVDITQKGPNAWAERFDHIDDHYAGRNNLSKKNHSDWIPVGPELPDVDLTRSSDASSDAGSIDENLVAVASRLPQGVSGQTRKRSLGDDDERPNSKRARTYMWRCCTCQWELVYEVNASCIACSHMRCSNCDVDCITSQDNNNAGRPAQSQE
ncbi:Putative Zinc finger C2H2-type [Colletotrichum destructivum]|uniref:Zinc finger C2H2-type n=1 Tax=Colletotrichum destructivum TaxID=34406 RepID=A0AAX4IZH8_9PEZI|nr:Putative Zinc finger C2H2-type [Colletotrichum destructivum]